MGRDATSIIYWGVSGALGGGVGIQEHPQQLWMDISPHINDIPMSLALAPCI